MNKEKNSSNKCPICGRPTHRESEYCIFHASAEEKTEKEFKRALKKYVNKIKKEDGDYDFKKFIFIGKIDFKEDLDVTIFKNADFRRAIFERDAGFEEATFKGDSRFGWVTFKGNADFRRAIFERDAGFEEATFKGGAYFGGAIFKGRADFEEATFKGDTGFEWVTFKGNAEFRRAIFERDADFIETTFEGGAYFGEVTFKVANFQKVTFKGNADFMGVTFERGAGFRGATFEGDSRFMEATFERDADFEEATFKGDSRFGWVTFKGNADFKRAIFEGDVYFRKATFKGPVSFSKAGFQSDVEYINLHFKKIVNFTFAVFRGKVNFKDIIFQDLVDFSNSEFKNPTYFVNIRAKSGISFGLSNFTSFLNLDLVCEKGIISFKGAFLENSFLAFNLGQETFIDFDYARLRNTEIRRVEIEGHILQEKERKFKKAKEIYYILRKNFVTIGRYGDRGWALIKEKLMERTEYSFYEYIKKKKEDLKTNMPGKNIILIIEFSKYLFSRNFLKWSNLYFLDVLLGYGEQPHKVIISSMFVILMFALVYSGIGISDPGDLEINSKIQNELSQGKIKIEGLTKLTESEFQKDLKFETKGQKDLKFEIIEFSLYEKKKNIPRKNFRDCLYFSLVIFTTLGLGDFHPLPECRIITGIEGLLGAILMGLFVAMLSRKFFGGQF